MSTVDWEKRYYNAKALLDEYSISENDSPFISDQAFICIKEIERLRDIASHINLDPDQVESLDKYTKILERDKAKPRKEKKRKDETEHDIGTLLKLASSSED